MSLQAGCADTFHAEVRDLASDGRGVISHPSGQTFFAAGVWLGESGKFRITGFQGRVGIAQCLSLETQSVYRINPPCPHHGFDNLHCGGCPWQFIDYSEQLRIKQSKVERSLQRLGVHSDVQVIWAAPKCFGYRNRAQLKTDGLVIGFMAAQSKVLAPIDDCLVLTDKNRNTLQRLLQQLPNKDWLVKSKRKTNKAWTHLDIDEDYNEASVNRRLPFQQANGEQNHRMQEWLYKKLQVLDKGKTIIELFCGSGNFTQTIASLGFKNILAVEVMDRALAKLRSKQLSGVTTLACNLFADGVFDKVNRHAGDAEVLILDPPREGLKQKQGLLTKKSKLEDIFYISCNLATLMRDLEFFMEHGFGIEEIQPLDQCPHTPHIELLVHLQRR